MPVSPPVPLLCLYLISPNRNAAVLVEKLKLNQFSPLKALSLHASLCRSDSAEFYQHDTALLSYASIFTSELSLDENILKIFIRTHHWLLSPQHLPFVFAHGFPRLQ